MPPEEHRPNPLWHRFKKRLADISIRLKIVGPYLLLTVLVAVSGIYMVTRLVSGSLDERLNNHLLESGRVVADTMIRREYVHQEDARAIAFTTGFADAVRARDIATALAIARPIAINSRLECLIVVDSEGHGILHMLAQDDGRIAAEEDTVQAGDIWVIQNLLDSGTPETSPIRGLVQHPNQQYYYFTAFPISSVGELVGVVAIGSALDTLLPDLKSTSLAEVTFYINDGRAIASTFIPQVDAAEVPQLLEDLRMTPAAFERRLTSPEVTAMGEFSLGPRSYRQAVGPLRMGTETLGVFSVAQSTEFIFTAGEASRNSYFLLFAAATLAVVGVGYATARLITRPLERLVQTSNAVAEGNLRRRTGIKSADEIGVLASTFDEMTERLELRNAELKELLRIQKETASRMRSILASIADGVLLEELQGTIVPLNQAAEMMLNELPEDFMFNPNIELEVPAPGEENYNPWLLAGRFQAHDKMISLHSAAVMTDDDERLGTVIVLRDITSEVEAEQLKDAFVEHVSHELRTPLTVIKGYSNLLLATAGDALSAQQHMFLRTIESHTENLISMINALLDFSEMAAKGRLGIRPQPLELPDLLQQLSEEWEPYMQEKTLDFRVEIPADLPTLTADGQRLRWALMNLIRNAWQYTPESGAVIVRVTPDAQHITIAVQDTGIGIAPEVRRQIFSRFFRVRNVDDDTVRGLGLGLYVTQAIVNAHGGTVDFTSELGEGSTFTVTLPIIAPGVSEDTLALLAPTERAAR